MRMLSKRTPCGAIFASLLLLTTTNLLGDINQLPKNRIDIGGYWFLTSYKSLITLLPPDLPIKLAFGRTTVIASCLNGPMFAGAFITQLEFTRDGVTTSIWSVRDKKHGEHITSTNIDTSSKQYAELATLVKKVSAMYHKAAGKHRKKHFVRYKSVVSEPSASPGYTLVATYRLHKKLCSSPAKSIVVDVEVSKKPLPGSPNAKVVIARATFRTKKEATTHDPVSVIEFMHTSNDLREISRKNIKQSSMWYSGVKEIVRRSMRKYFKFRNVHNILKRPEKKSGSPFPKELYSLHGGYE